MSENSPTISLALGGGGARGIAHIAALEAFDELGVKPVVIAGSSMGAVVAAAYASGMRAHDIREYALDVLRSRAVIARRLFSGRASDVLSLLDISPRVPALVDGERVLEVFLPEQVAVEFDQLEIPLMIIATDFYARSAHVIETGAILPALAASVALPAVMIPRLLGGRVMIDGAIVNPLPFDLLLDRSARVVAIDVTGGPVGGGSDMPNPIDLLFRTTQIMQHQIVEAKLGATPVDVLIRPDVDEYRVLDFHKVRQILESAAAAKDELKRALEKIMDGPAA